jgi:hypothetical protein
MIPTAQKKAELKQNDKRRGTPTFSAVRLNSVDEKKLIDDVVKRCDGTRREALLQAFSLLKLEQDK